MKHITYTLLLFSLVLFGACEKEYSYEGGTLPPTQPLPPDPEPEPEPEPQPVDVFKNLLLSGSFQLKAFYSDIPIDFLENDEEIKAETNLWWYVAEYLKDDVNTFSDNGEDLTIQQIDKKKPGLADAVVHRQYAVSIEGDEIYISFVDANYDPLVYKLHEVGDTYFIISLEWKDGATLFSKFEMLP